MFRKDKKMKNYGFMRVAAASPRVKVADVNFNVDEICRIADKAEADDVSLLVFPELSLTGYTCGDLFSQTLLLDAAENGISRLRAFSRGKELTMVVGAPVRCNSRLYNCAVVIRNGMVYGIVPKICIPTYGEFHEIRWFSSGSDFMNAGSKAFGSLHDDGKNCYREGFAMEIDYAGFRTTIAPNQLFHIGDATFAVEICEDLWTPIPPSSFHALSGAQVIVNISASNEVVNKHSYRKGMIASLSSRIRSAYIYASPGFGESTQDTVFAGSSLIYENGFLMAENERFSCESGYIVADVDVELLKTLRQKSNTYAGTAPDGTHTSVYHHYYSHVDIGSAVNTDFDARLLRHVDPHPFVPKPSELDLRAREIVSIQVQGLTTRLSHIGCRTAVVGISGGLDSTLALLVAVMAFDKLGWARDRIIGITMPGFGTTDRTHDNAVDLMTALGVTQREISIVPSVRQHFADIGHDASNHDVTYENSQARERTQILMDVANMENGIVVGTGDLSELALGWATYNGDHMSMYGVNAGVPKTLVKYLVKWAAENCFDNAQASGRGVREILLDIVDTPISPELIPADEDGNITQKTEDLVGPYELHDFFIHNFLSYGYSPEKILFLARKAFLDGENDFVGPEGKAVRYDEETIKKWLKKFIWRFFSQQFKRSCIPDGPKVGSVSLSPRGDLIMPSDASSELFYKSLE